jgi:hypothetical protein
MDSKVRENQDERGIMIHKNERIVARETETRQKNEGRRRGFSFEVVRSNSNQWASVDSSDSPARLSNPITIPQKSPRFDRSTHDLQIFFETKTHRMLERRQRKQKEKGTSQKADDDNINNSNHRTFFLDHGVISLEM